MENDKRLQTLCLLLMAASLYTKKQKGFADPKIQAPRSLGSGKHLDKVES